MDDDEVDAAAGVEQAGTPAARTGAAADQDVVANASTTARGGTAPEDREREIARMYRLYTSLSQINKAIVSAGSRDELFGQACRILIEHGGFRLAWIGWHDADNPRLEPVAAAGDDGGYVSGIEVYADDRPEGGGPSGTAFRSGRPYICNDMLRDPATQPWRAGIQRQGFRASAVFPIREGGRVRGTLSVYSDQPDFFQDREIALLTETAGDVSFALDNLAREEERARAERAAQSEKVFSATLMESMPGILYFYDAQGRFLRWNRNFEAVSGYSGAEIRRMHPLDFFAEADKSVLQSRIAAVFEDGEAFVEAPLLTKDGRAVPHLFTGRRVVYNDTPCLIGMGIDISKRIEAERELLRIRGRLEAVVEHLGEGLVIADEDDDLLLWNPASLRLLGFNDLEEGQRRQREFSRIFDLYTLDGDQIPPERWPLARVRRGETLDEYQAVVRRADRDWERIFSYSGGRVRYAAGRSLAFMTLQDITDRKRAEIALRGDRDELERQVTARTADLQAALTRAEAADRIKSAFLATMSHELRTPLNSIIGFTGILAQGLAGPLTGEQSKQLGMVQNSARHLLALINDVLDISKIEAGQMDLHVEPFGLGESLERVAATVRPMAQEKGLTLQAAVPPGLTHMRSDQRRVEQILLNLLNNAVKFTERGGITLSAATVPDYRRSPEGPPCAAVRFEVSDTGIGIKPDDLATLFQPFRQLDSSLTRRYEGTGLGLAICRRLAALLQGEIRADSEWGKGTRFTVTLPLRLEPDR